MTTTSDFFNYFSNIASALLTALSLITKVGGMSW